MEPLTFNKEKIVKVVEASGCSVRKLADSIKKENQHSFKRGNVRNEK